MYRERDIEICIHIYTYEDNTTNTTISITNNITSAIVISILVEKCRVAQKFDHCATAVGNHYVRSQ